MKRTYYASVTPTLTLSEYQMAEIFEAAYSAGFDGDVAAYITQNVDLDGLGLRLIEGDNLGDIIQAFGPHDPVNICVIRRAVDNAPVEVWFAAEA